MKEHAMSDALYEESSSDSEVSIIEEVVEKSNSLAPTNRKVATKSKGGAKKRLHL